MNALVISVISISATILGMILGYAGYSRTMKKDSSAKGKLTGEMLTEIRYIKQGVDEIKVRQKDADDRHIDIVKSIACLETSIKQAHKRIDGIERNK